MDRDSRGQVCPPAVLSSVMFFGGDVFCFGCLLQNRYFKRNITSQTWILAGYQGFSVLLFRPCAENARLRCTCRPAAYILTVADLTLGETETHLGLASPNLDWTLGTQPWAQARPNHPECPDTCNRYPGPEGERLSLWLGGRCPLNAMCLPAVCHLEKRAWAGICLGTSALAPLPGAHQGMWGKGPFLGRLPRSRSSAQSPLEVTTGCALCYSSHPLFCNLP